MFVFYIIYIFLLFHSWVETHQLYINTTLKLHILSMAASSSSGGCACASACVCVHSHVHSCPCTYVKEQTDSARKLTNYK